MRKLLVVSALALTAMTSGAMAAEQLTASQLDQVTAGFFDRQSNRNFTLQIALASADGNNVCAVAVCQQANGGAIAVANNSNSTRQKNRD
jgi:hypothetical protein